MALWSDGPEVALNWQIGKRIITHEDTGEGFVSFVKTIKVKLISNDTSMLNNTFVYSITQEKRDEFLNLLGPFAYPV